MGRHSRLFSGVKPYILAPQAPHLAAPQAALAPHLDAPQAALALTFFALALHAPHLAPHAPAVALAPHLAPHLAAAQPAAKAWPDIAAAVTTAVAITLESWLERLLIRFPWVKDDTDDSHPD